MRRKLVKQGENALTITLPSKWVKENNLNPKDEIEITEEEAGLVISTESKRLQKKIEFSLKSSNRKYIDAMYRNFYINGYDEIRAMYASEEDYMNIVKAIEPLIGYEIDSASKKGCVVKNLSEFEQQDYEPIFKKLFYIIFSMQELVEKLIIGKHELHDNEQITQLNRDSSKFACFCRRIIFKTNLLKNEQALTKYTIINTLHMIARNYSVIYQNKPSKKELEYVKAVSTYFRKLFDAYGRNDLEAVNDVMGQRSNLIEEGIKLAEKGNIATMHYLMEIVRLNGTIAGKVGFLSTLK